MYNLPNDKLSCHVASLLRSCSAVVAVNTSHCCLRSDFLGKVKSMAQYFEIVGRNKYKFKA